MAEQKQIRSSANSHRKRNPAEGNSSITPAQSYTQQSLYECVAVNERERERDNDKTMLVKLRSWAHINRNLKSSLKIHLNYLKLVMHFNHHLISMKSEVAHEIKAKIQHQFQIKMDFRTRNSL